MLTSVSAGPEKFYWMRYASERATNIEHAQAKIVKGDLFGVRELKGKPYDEFVLTDGTRFTLPIKKSDMIMNRAKEFKGKTPTLQAKKPVKTVAKPVAKTVSKRPVKVKVPTKLSMPDGSRIKLKDVELPDVEDFTDYDLPTEFSHYRVENSAANSLPKVTAQSRPRSN